MKKKQLGLVVFFFMLAMLCACGLSGRDKPDFTYIPKADEYSDEAISGTEEGVNGSAIEVHSVGDFSSGRAWIRYKIPAESGDEDFDSCVGCVDKTGKVLFSYLSDSIRETSEFNNGVAFIRDKDGTWYIIDEDGDVLTTSLESNFEEILAYGDGYFLCYEDRTRFSSAENCYKVMDQSGEIIKEIVYAKGDYSHPDSDFMNQNPYYAGDGIFAFIRSGGYGHGRVIDFYNIKNGMEFSCDEISGNYLPDRNIKFDGGVTFVKRKESPKYILLYSDGNQEELHLEISDTLCYDTNVSEDKLIIIDYDDNPAGLDRIINMSYYSIANKTFHLLDQYIDHMYMEGYASNGYKVVEDCILVYLLGEDELPYIAVINTDNETIVPPTQSDLSSCVSCGRIVINTEDGAIVYDLEGNVIFALSDIPRAAPGKGLLSNYSDDVAIRGSYRDSSGSEEWIGPQYIDVQGNNLFDAFDFSSTKMKTLN